MYLEDWPNAWHVYLNWPALGSAGGRRPKCRFWSDNLSGLSGRAYVCSHMGVEHGSKACRNNVWFCSWKIFSDGHSRSSAVSAGPDTLPNALRWEKSVQRRRISKMGQRRCLADRHCLKRLGRKMAAPAWRPLQNWNFQSPRKDDIFASKSERAWKIWKVWKLLPSCQKCSNTKYSKSHKPAPIESEPLRLGQKERQCVSDFLRVLRSSTLRAFNPRGTGTAECPRTFSRPCFQSWTSIYWLVDRQRDIRTLDRTWPNAKTANVHTGSSVAHASSMCKPMAVYGDSS